MSDPAPANPNLFGALRRLLGSLLATIENRLQLFAVEFKTEKYRLVELIVLTLLAVFFGLMAVVLFAITLVMLVPAEYQLHVVAGVGLLSALGALVTAWRVRARLKAAAPFNETLAQLQKDREWFSTKN